MLKTKLDDLREVMGETLSHPVEEMGPATTMRSCDTWDSMSHLDLVLALEERFGVVLTTSQVTRMQSFEEIVSVLDGLGVMDGGG